jgi:hypothetical protein
MQKKCVFEKVLRVLSEQRCLQRYLLVCWVSKRCGNTEKFYCRPSENVCNPSPFQKLSKCLTTFIFSFSSNSPFQDPKLKNLLDSRPSTKMGDSFIPKNSAPTVSLPIRTNSQPKQVVCAWELIIIYFGAVLPKLALCRWDFDTLKWTERFFPFYEFEHKYWLRIEKGMHRMRKGNQYRAPYELCYTYWFFM